MRDPKRIYIIADELVHHWVKYPDLRLGQIISNVMHGCGTDLFYIEDEELLEKIKKYFEEVKWNQESNLTI